MEEKVKYTESQLREFASILKRYGYEVIKPVLSCEEDESVSFEKWWIEYDKKCDKKKAEAKWNKLSTEEKKQCIKSTKVYVKSTPDKKFRKNPLTYLNGECWNDEIIPRGGNDMEIGVILHNTQNKDYGKGTW